MNERGEIRKYEKSGHVQKKEKKKGRKEEYSHEKKKWQKAKVAKDRKKEERIRHAKNEDSTTQYDIYIKK